MLYLCLNLLTYPKCNSNLSPLWKLQFLKSTHPIAEKRDVVFLIDGTTAVRSEFPSIRDMIGRVVEKLDVGLDKVRVSVVQYSDDPKIEFLLNAHSTKNEVLQAVLRLRNKGGNNLNTGRALEFVARRVYQRSGGSRLEERVPQFLILVTAGKSTDDVSSSANELKKSLIAPLAIGTRNADQDELRQISMKPELVYTVDSLRDFSKVEKQLIDSAVTDCLHHLLFIIYLHCYGGISFLMLCFCFFSVILDLGKKDIIFLIDGSDNTDSEGIAHIRDFILKIVEQLDVQPDKIRVALVQYADKVKTEFSLNSHNNKAAVLSAIRRLRQMGGRSSDLADAIDHVLRFELNSFAGARPTEASQHLVVLTGGRSPQDVSLYGPLRVEELRLSGKKMMKHKVHSGIIYPEIAKVISELKYVAFWKTGVNSFILVGLEGVPNLEEASLLEFGRGFRYTRPLRLNIMDLDYELLEELVGTDD
uniref:VWFA domain-containing protein n=1 Tax=Pundamilia nyererei TaxID=303518 RepID=A0A3B4GGN5_9CICH